MKAKVAEPVGAEPVGKVCYGTLAELIRSYRLQPGERIYRVVPYDSAKEIYVASKSQGEAAITALDCEVGTVPLSEQNEALNEVLGEMQKGQAPF